MASRSPTISVVLFTTQKVAVWLAIVVAPRQVKGELPYSIGYSTITLDLHCKLLSPAESIRSFGGATSQAEAREGARNGLSE